jgi:hypothetical protein
MKITIGTNWAKRRFTSQKFRAPDDEFGGSGVATVPVGEGSPADEGASAFDQDEEFNAPADDEYGATDPGWRDWEKIEDRHETPDSGVTDEHFAPPEETPAPEPAPVETDSAHTESPQSPPEENSAPSPEASEQSQQEAPVFDQAAAFQQQELFRRASQIGMTQTDIEKYGSTEQLQAAVDYGERMFDAFLQHQANLDQQAAAQQAAAQQAQAQLQGQQAQAQQFQIPSREKFEKEIQQMRDEGVHETLINDRIQQRGILEHQMAQAEAQRQYNDQLAAYIQNQREDHQRQVNANNARTNLAWFDQQMKTVPDAYRDVLGKDPMTFGMNQLSPEFKARNKLMIRIQNEQENWQVFGHSGPDDPGIFNKALLAEFGTRGRTQAVNEVKEALRKNENQVVSRPTQSESGKLSRREQALENAENHPYWGTLDGDMDDDPEF